MEHISCEGCKCYGGGTCHDRSERGALLRDRYHRGVDRSPRLCYQVQEIPRGTSLVAPRTVNLEERSAILQRIIVKYVDLRWRVVSQTQTTAQLTRDKRASCLVALLLCLLFILPAILYLLLYKGTENVYLEVKENGQVLEHGAWDRNVEVEGRSAATGRPI